MKKRIKLFYVFFYNTLYFGMRYEKTYNVIDYFENNFLFKDYNYINISKNFYIFFYSKSDMRYYEI